MDMLGVCKILCWPFCSCVSIIAYYIFLSSVLNNNKALKAHEYVLFSNPMNQGERNPHDYQLVHANKSDDFAC